MSANIEENIANPAVKPKNSPAVQTAVKHLITAFGQAGYDAKGVRNGEVAMISIPCRQLFAPNNNRLRADADKLLNPLWPYIKRTDLYKVILAVHSDDTGDELYAEQLTSERANAIDEFYYKSNENTDTGIIPYGLGSDEPVAPNTGIANREKNRRVEIYFVPTEAFIDKARKGK